MKAYPKLKVSRNEPTKWRGGSVRQEYSSNREYMCKGLEGKKSLRQKPEVIQYV